MTKCDHIIRREYGLADSQDLRFLAAQEQASVLRPLGTRSLAVVKLAVVSAKNALRSFCLTRPAIR